MEAQDITLDIDSAEFAFEELEARFEMEALASPNANDINICCSIFG